MVDGLRVCDPQVVLLQARACHISQEFEYRTQVFDKKIETYPEWTVPESNVPEIFKEPLILRPKYHRCPER